MMATSLRALLLLNVAHATALTIAGYTFQTTAGQKYGTLDNQIAAMGNASRYADSAATLAAYEAVEQSSGRSIQSLIEEVVSKELASDEIAAYWGDARHADAFVLAAITATDAAASWDPISRRELLLKGAAYQVVRQHIFARLRAGVKYCNDRALANQTSGAIFEWEAAYALHSGALELSNGTGKGWSTYALADKRCPQFGTCIRGTHPARSNVLALRAWEDGVHALSFGDCLGAMQSYRAIVAQLTVPLVQGMLREAYEVDPLHGRAAADGVVEVAEGWAFTAAILPQVALCNQSAASLIERNMALSLDGSNGSHVADGFRVVKKAIEAEYPCLLITCIDVGGMLTSGRRIQGFEPCTSDEALAPGNSGTTRVSTAGLVTFIIAAVLIALDNLRMHRRERCQRMWSSKYGGASAEVITVKVSEGQQQSCSAAAYASNQSGVA